MLTPRKNYLNVFLHQPTEYVPCSIVDSVNVGFGAKAGPWFEKGPAGGGCTASACSGKQGRAERIRRPPLL